MIDSDKRGGASLTFSRMASTSTQSFLNSKLSDKAKLSPTELVQLESIRKIKKQENLSKINSEKVSEKPIVSNQSARKSIHSSKYISSNISDSKLTAETEGGLVKKDSEKNGLTKNSEVEDDKSGKENWADEDEDMKRVLENIQKDLNVIEENKRGKTKSSFYFEKVSDNWKRLNSSVDSSGTTWSSNALSKQTVESEKNQENTVIQKNSFLKYKNDEFCVKEKTKYSTEEEIFRKPQEPIENERYSPDLAEEEENELLGPAQSDDDDDNETDLDLTVDTDGPMLDDECDLDSNAWEVIDEVATSSADGSDEEMDTTVTETKDAESGNECEGTIVETDKKKSNKNEIKDNDSSNIDSSDSPTDLLRDYLNNKKDSQLLNNPDSSRPNICNVSDDSSKDTPKLKMLLKLEPKSNDKRSSLDIPLFDNTGEEGMQEDVNRVVQQILVNIADEDVCSSAENFLVQDIQNKKQSSNCTLCANERHCSCLNKDSKLESSHLENTDNKEDSKSVNNSNESEVYSKPSIDSFDELLEDHKENVIKEEKPIVDHLSIKRKLDNVSENDERSEVLTVKKVKLDTDLIHDEKKDLELDKESVKIKGEIIAAKEEKDIPPKEVLLNELKKEKPIKEETSIVEDDDDVKIEKIEKKSDCEKSSKKKIKVTQSELEEIIKRRICLYFTDEQKSELGKLKVAYETLKKDREKWKQTTIQLQKQVTELQNVVQRQLRLNKKQGSTPTKVATRSVGLQVHMQSFVIPESSKSPLRSTPTTSNNIKVLTPAQPQTLLVNKQDTNLAVVNIGNVSLSSSHQTLAKSSTVLSTSRLSTTVTPVQLPGAIVNRPQLTASLAAPPASQQRSPIPTLGIPKVTSGNISILQARNNSTQPVTTLSIGSSVTATPSSTAVPKVASVITPTRSTVRNLLDNQRGQGSAAVSSLQLPVPMRLIQNQAAAKQASPVRLNSSNANPSGVKFIDLTADEDEASNSQAQSVTITPTSTAKQISTFPTQGQVTLIAAGTQGQTLPNGPIIFNTTPVTGTVAVSNSSNLSVRMPSPLRMPQPSIVTQAIPSVNSGQRFTYLVPSTAVMRPTQQVYITSAPQPRTVQPITTQSLMRSTGPTLVFPKGTLVPVQSPGSVPQVQSATTSQGTVRPVGLPQVVRPTVTLPSAAISSQSESKASSPNPSSKSGTAAIGSSSKPPTSNDSSNNQAIVVSRITPKHPAPLPASTVYSGPATMKALPPKPALKISKVNNGIVLSWNMSLNASHADIASYQLYAYQEGSAPPNTNLWKKVGDVKALPLPMACTLTQFMEGHKYHFAVRAVDVHNRIGQFSDPGSIVLCNSNASTSNSSGIRV